MKSKVKFWFRKQFILKKILRLKQKNKRRNARASSFFLFYNIYKKHSKIKRKRRRRQNKLLVQKFKIALRLAKFGLRSLPNFFLCDSPTDRNEGAIRETLLLRMPSKAFGLPTRLLDLSDITYPTLSSSKNQEQVFFIYLYFKYLVSQILAFRKTISASRKENYYSFPSAFSLIKLSKKARTDWFRKNQKLIIKNLINAGIRKNLKFKTFSSPLLRLEKNKKTLKSNLKKIKKQKLKKKKAGVTFIKPNTRVLRVKKVDFLIRNRTIAERRRIKQKKETLILLENEKKKI